jgi:hypothetical protein
MPHLDAKRRDFGGFRKSVKVSSETAMGRRISSYLKLASLVVALFATALAGCGGGSKPGFTLEVAPSTISVVPGGPAQSLTVGASPVNGFTGSVSVALSSLPTGVTATPSTLTLTAGTLQQISITASSSATSGSSSITLTGTSGALSAPATAALTVGAPPPIVTSATLSTSTFDFGNNLLNNTVSQTVTVVTNTGRSPLTMSPVLTGDPSFAIVAGQSCGASLAPSATCDMIVSYDPTVGTATPVTQNTVLNMGFANVAAATPQTVAISGTSASLAAGKVTATNNPQVALYTMTLPFPGSMMVNFGTTTAYGLKTWSQTTDTGGCEVSIFVAGMQATTAYHMAATVQLSNGITATDADHTFTTGQLSKGEGSLGLRGTTAPGMTPQPGLEMLNPLTSVAVSDLSGKPLWFYAEPGSQALNILDGVKMLPNGDLLMVIGPTSSLPLNGPAPADAYIEIREVNLAGDTVREITVNDLNAELLAATCAECQVTLQTFHHDIEPLPNGHWLVLSNALMSLSSTSTPPLTNLPAQTVLGDVIVDLDENLQPVWAWNEFNHMDPNRHPYLFPDWTHTNALLYSPDDGNILVSIRHQNWVVKVNYANGTGNGSILWHLGEGGDFTLQGGTDPTDWEYAQHEPNFFSTNTTGVFSLGLMDNGDDRIFPTGVTCGTSGAPPCLYSTVPVFKIDESAKTATLTFHQMVPPAQYNFFGGNTEQLANGNVEYDLCGTNNGSYVFEVTQEANPQTVWSMTSGFNLYRAFRIPSLYPGVQW